MYFWTYIISRTCRLFAPSKLNLVLLLITLACMFLAMFLSGTLDHMPGTANTIDRNLDGML
jgi:hypothetical protein